MISQFFILIQMVVPFFSLYFIAFHKGVSLFYRIISALMWSLVAVFFFIIRSSDVKLFFGKLTYFFYIFLFFILLIFSFLRWVGHLQKGSFLPKGERITWFKLILSIGVIGLVFIFSIRFQLYSVRKYPKNEIELLFPVKNGRYLVNSGGSSQWFNRHFSIRAQKYALNIVKINSWGLRILSFFGKAPEKYRIFGEPVYAPCSGEIISIGDSNHNTILVRKKENEVFGKYVVIFCKKHSVLMAYFEEESLSISIGDWVEAGAFMGQIRNLSREVEPYFHIHAVQGKVLNFEELFFKAEGVPMLFYERFLIKNDEFFL